MASVSEDVINLVRAGMRQVRVPGAYDKVYKDECGFSFDTPFSPGGLYVNLVTMQGFGAAFVALDHQKSGNPLYLLQQHTKVPVPKEEHAEDGPTRMAIGMEGGFQVEDKFTVEKAHSLVLFPSRATILYPCAHLPELVIQAIDAVIKHAGTLHQEEVAAWQEGPLRVSKYAKDLEQLNNGKKIPPNPSGWVCEESGMKENLWLNLSTGQIGSGRKNWDGSGGTGAAMNQFVATGSKYPLVVKLGTITPQGADVFSYAPDEDDLVEDPYLAEHLSHWGIDVMKMEKTEKSMAELTVELNKTFEFDKITEAGADLAPLSGPGYVGLKNLGNSCYLNSVMQVLHNLPEIQQRYANRASQIFQAAPAGAELVSDFVVQMAKLGVGLTTDRYCDSAPAEGDKTSSLEPRTFKTLVGRGHSEFSSNRQQDACEYLQHLLEVMTKAERAASTSDSELPSTSSLFKFQYEDRIQCIESGKVTYKTRSDNMLGLMIPMEAATNKFEVEQFQDRESKRQKLKEAGAEAYIHSGPERGAGGAGTLTAADENHPPVKPIVPFQACLHKFIADEMVEDFYSSAMRRKAVASKAVRMRTFPPYLAVQMRRYFVGPDWTPKKLDVLVQVPETLSLEALRGKGMQEGELPLPEEEVGGEGGGRGESTAAPALAQVPNEEIVMQLVGMGFSENGSKRASLATGNTSAEASMEWVFSHMEDPDFNDPLPPPAPVAAAVPLSRTAAAEQVADPESVAMLTSMGFTAVQAKGALKATQGVLERAADWLFSHADNLDAALAGVSESSASVAATPAASGAGEGAASFQDGNADYELAGFVSHMGGNTGCGHYVCHVKKDGRWVLYNDEKVAVSQKPPLDLGYLYIYKRVQA